MGSRSKSSDNNRRNPTPCCICCLHSWSGCQWNYLSQAVPNTGDLFQPLKGIICQRFLPTLTGQNTFSDSVWDLTALPSRLGGLGIVNPVKQAESQHRTSRKVTASLIKHIIEQSRKLPAKAQEEQFEAKRTASRENHQPQTTEVNNLLIALPNSLQKAVETV